MTSHFFWYSDLLIIGGSYAKPWITLAHRWPYTNGISVLKGTAHANAGIHHRNGRVSHDRTRVNFLGFLVKFIDCIKFLEQKGSSWVFIYFYIANQIFKCINLSLQHNSLKLKFFLSLRIFDVYENWLTCFNQDIKIQWIEICVFFHVIGKKCRIVDFVFLFMEVFDEFVISTIFELVATIF